MAKATATQASAIKSDVAQEASISASPHITQVAWPAVGQTSCSQCVGLLSEAVSTEH